MSLIFMEEDYKNKLNNYMYCEKTHILVSKFCNYEMLIIVPKLATIDYLYDTIKFILDPDVNIKLYIKWRLINKFSSYLNNKIELEQKKLDVYQWIRSLKKIILTL